jgi:hypothetical protein
MLEFPGAVFRPAIYEVTAVWDELGWVVLVGLNPFFCRGFRKGLMEAKQAHRGPGPEDDGRAGHIESMSALGRLCGFAHTSVREAIERAREERDEGH